MKAEIFATITQLKLLQRSTVSIENQINDELVNSEDEGPMDDTVNNLRNADDHFDSLIRSLEKAAGFMT